jgi:hypothetical protein
LNLAQLTTQLAVTQSVTTNANSIVTGLTDTISQQIPGVPEPASLAILGSALFGFGWLYRRQSRR